MGANCSKLSNFTLQDIDVTDKQRSISVALLAKNTCHTKEIENVTFKDVKLNGNDIE